MTMDPGEVHSASRARDRLIGMKLKALLDELPEKRLAAGSEDTEIHGVAYDSRKVRASDLFVAVRGYQLDGHDFVADAIAHGASAVVVEASHPPILVPAGVSLVSVPDSRRALSRLSASFY